MTPVTIVGAGIVGICCAIALADRGHRVTLIDKRAPGQETSRWNAGVLATSSVIPLNNPGLFAKLPRMMLGQFPGLRINLRAGPKLLPWAVQFLNNARPARSNHITQSLTSLITFSRLRHEALCARAGAHILQPDGWLIAYRGANGGPRAQSYAKTLAHRGVAARVLLPPGLGALEPNLKPVFSAAIHVVDSAFTQPDALVAAYLKLARALGVQVIAHPVTNVTQSSAGFTLTGPNGFTHTAAQVVLATGPWVNDLLGKIAKPLPMAIERGYLQCFAAAHHPTRPFLDIDAGYVASPRPGGVQISTGTELTALGTKPNSRQLNAALTRANDALDLGRPLQNDFAVGNRPSLPDSLPVIGPVRQAPGLWIAAGHQHVGLSTSAGTADLLACLIGQKLPPIDPKPFSAERFGL
jgi:D-amino-acid dehydrogenase